MIRKIKDRTRSRFNLAVTEVGGQDTWQRLELGFALVGNDQPYVESTLEKVVRFIESMGVAEIVAEQRETLNYGELDTTEARRASQDEWVPSEWLQDADQDKGEAP